VQEYELHILKKSGFPSRVFLSAYLSDRDAEAAARILVLDSDSFEVRRGPKCIYTRIVPPDPAQYSSR